MIGTCYRADFNQKEVCQTLQIVHLSLPTTGISNQLAISVTSSLIDHVTKNQHSQS